MRPARFQYFVSKSAAEARELLAEHRNEARLLAGGQSLVPLMNLRMSKPAVLIDLNLCDDLRYIEVRNTHVAYGAMTRQIDAQNSPLTAQHCPLVAKALALAGPIAVRSWGTVGGQLAHADRSAELPAVATALDAVFVIDGVRGRRECTGEHFFVDDFTTDIGEGEMLCEVRFPVQPHDIFSTFLEVGTRQRDMALAGLAAEIDVDSDGVCVGARLAVAGVSASPVRLREIESSLMNARIEEDSIKSLSERACALIEASGDLHASAEYRRQVTGALLAQALAQAVSARLGAR